MKYLLRIRQVALAGFHFTYDIRDKFREEKERQMRDDEGEKGRQREKNAGKHRK